MKTPYFVVFFALACGCAKSSGLDEDDVAKLDVGGSVADVAKRIPGADTKGTRIYWKFKKDAFFDELQLDWNASQGRAAPQWIALEASKDATNDERTRLGATLHGGLLPGDAWIFGPIRIALKANGSLEGTIDPKPGGTPNPMFEKQSQIMLHVFAQAAFGSPLGVSADDMRDAFACGYKTADLAKIDPATPTSNAAAATLAIFPGASANGPHVEIALDSPSVPFVRLDWDDAPTGKIGKALFTTTWNGNRRAIDDCLKKAHVDGATFKVEGNLTTVTPASPSGFTKDAWNGAIAAVDACH